MQACSLCRTIFKKKIRLRGSISPHAGSGYALKPITPLLITISWDVLVSHAGTMANKCCKTSKSQLIVKQCCKTVAAPATSTGLLLLLLLLLLFDRSAQCLSACESSRAARKDRQERQTHHKDNVTSCTYIDTQQYACPHSAETCVHRENNTAFTQHRQLDLRRLVGEKQKDTLCTYFLRG